MQGLKGSGVGVVSKMGVLNGVVVWIGTVGCWIVVEIDKIVMKRSKPSGICLKENYFKKQHPGDDDWSSSHSLVKKSVWEFSQRFNKCFLNYRN